MTFTDPDQGPPQSLMDKLFPNRATGWIILASCSFWCLVIGGVIYWMIERQP